MKIAFSLTGITALLMHNDDFESSDMLNAWRKAPANKGISVAGDDRSPAWTWHTYLYHDGKYVAIPGQNMMACLKQAANQMILKKNKTFKEVSQSGMGIYSEFLEFRNSGKQISIQDVISMQDLDFRRQQDLTRNLGFRLFGKRAKIGTSKHLRIRPRFDNWSASGELIVVAPELTFDALKQMFELAGRVGLCDWRPGSKSPGPFGMFTATLEKID